MRGVQAAGGNHEFDWPIARILATADKAVGLDVMRGLYARLGDKPESVDLVSLWTQLGVEGAGAGLHFDDAAPFATARLAITARPAAG